MAAVCNGRFLDLMPTCGKIQKSDSEGDLPAEAVAPASPAPLVQQQAPKRIPPGPHFEALTSEEKKMLRTLWRVQSEYISQGKQGLWGFMVREDARGLVALTISLVRILKPCGQECFVLNC